VPFLLFSYVQSASKAKLRRSLARRPSDLLPCFRTDLCWKIPV
jgi:hypothetical protein